MRMKTIMVILMGAALATGAAQPLLADNLGTRAAAVDVQVGRGAGGQWAVLAGSSLKQTLQGWADAAGWSLVWDNPVDYKVRASVTFSGDFLDSVGRLVDAVYQTNPELAATIYRGNRVIHVYDLATATN